MTHQVVSKNEASLSCHERSDKDVDGQPSPFIRRDNAGCFTHARRLSCSFYRLSFILRHQHPFLWFCWLFIDVAAYILRASLNRSGLQSSPRLSDLSMFLTYIGDVLDFPSVVLWIARCFLNLYWTREWRGAISHQHPQSRHTTHAVPLRARTDLCRALLAFRMLSCAPSACLHPRPAPQDNAGGKLAEAKTYTWLGQGKGNFRMRQACMHMPTSCRSRCWARSSQPASRLPMALTSKCCHMEWQICHACSLLYTQEMVELDKSSKLPCPATGKASRYRAFRSVKGSGNAFIFPSAALHADILLCYA